MPVTRVHVWLAGLSSGPVVVTDTEECVLEFPETLVAAERLYVVVRVFFEDQDGGRAVLRLRPDAECTADVIYPNAVRLKPTARVIVSAPYVGVRGAGLKFPTVAVPRAVTVGGVVFETDNPTNFHEEFRDRRSDAILRVLRDRKELGRCQRMGTAKEEAMALLRPANSTVRNLTAPYSTGPDEAGVPGATFLLQAPSKPEDSTVLYEATANAAGRQGLARHRLATLDDRARVMVFLELLQSPCTHLRYLSDTAYDVSTGTVVPVERYSSDTRLIGRGDCEDMAKEAHMLFCALRDLETTDPAMSLMRDTARGYVAALSFMGATTARLGEPGAANICHAALLLMRGDEFDRRSVNPNVRFCRSVRYPSDPPVLIVEGTNVKALYDPWETRPDANAVVRDKLLKGEMKTYRRRALEDFYREVTYLLTSDVVNKATGAPVTDLYVADKRTTNAYGASIDPRVYTENWAIRPVTDDEGDVEQVKLALRAVALEQPIPRYPRVDLETEERQEEAFLRFLGDPERRNTRELAGPVVLRIYVARLLHQAFETGACRFVRTEAELQAFGSSPSFFLSAYQLEDEAVADACARTLMGTRKLCLARIDRVYRTSWGVQFLVPKDDDHLVLSLFGNY